MKKNKAITVIKKVAVAVVLLFSVPAIGQQPLKLSDPEVASIAVTANQIDIDYAQIALARSKNANVLNFAKTMINDHKAVIAQAVALVTKLNVTPQTNSLTKKITD